MDKLPALAALLIASASASFAFVAGSQLAGLRAEVDNLRAQVDTPPAASRPNVSTDFNGSIDSPTIGSGAYVDPKASVIGAVNIESGVYVGPMASIRGDEGQPIHLGANCNVQDGVVIHALETESHGEPVDGRTYEVHGRDYAVYVGERVSLAHQALVHGPAAIGDDTFVGMQALVFKARVGRGAVIEPGAVVLGVTVADGRYVPAGAVINTQAEADALPQIDDAYPFRALNAAVVHVNTSFADAYQTEPVEHGEMASAHH